MVVVSTAKDMQALWSTIINRLTMVMAKGGQDTKRQYEVLQRYNDSALGAIGSIDPAKDQALYVDYNKRPFFPPAEFTFESVERAFQTAGRGS